MPTDNDDQMWLPFPVEPVVNSKGRTHEEVLEAIRRSYPAPSLPMPNPKEAFGDAKTPLHLVPPALNIAASVGLAEGAEKYGAYNWRTLKVKSSTYIGAIERHLAAYKDGEDVDPDSKLGKTHLAGIAASLAILIDSTEGGFLIDDRPPPGPAPRLVLKK